MLTVAVREAHLAWTINSPSCDRQLAVVAVAYQPRDLLPPPALAIRRRFSDTDPGAVLPADLHEDSQTFPGNELLQPSIPWSFVTSVPGLGFTVLPTLTPNAPVPPITIKRI